MIKQENKTDPSSLITWKDFTTDGQLKMCYLSMRLLRFQFKEPNPVSITAACLWVFSMLVHMFQLVLEACSLYTWKQKSPWKGREITTHAIMKHKQDILIALLFGYYTETEQPHCSQEINSSIKISP